VDRRRYLSVSKASAALDAVLCKLVPEDAVFRMLRRYNVWFYLSIAMAVFIIVAYSVNTYRFIHKPLSRLAAAFQRVEKGAFDVAIEHTHDDEFRYIYRQFNGMVEEPRTLIDQVYNQKILVQRASGWNSWPTPWNPATGRSSSPSWMR
jgi:two-component system, sensor histidine kinase YesM